MKKLNHIFAFRIVIFLCISIYFSNIYLTLFILIFLLLFNWKESLAYVILFILIFISNINKYDFIKIGIVDKKVNNYYIVNKLLYEDKINNEDNINIGDIIITINYEQNTEISNLKKNIKFNIKEYRKVGSIRVKNYFYNRVQSFNSDISEPLNKFIYNINTYDESIYNLGYGLASYYLLKKIIIKNRKIGLLSIILYSVLFCFDIKFYLLLFDIFYYKLKISRNNKFNLKIIFILIINKYLLLNYSFLIPSILNMYDYINFRILFKQYLCIIESLLFSNINVLISLFYKYYIILEIIILMLSILTIFIDRISYLYLIMINIFDLINNINIAIRGKISIILTVLYVIILKTFNIKNINLKYILFLILLISPLNNPFSHITFIDVGQGDATLIKYGLNTNILIDTGSRYNYYLLKKHLFSESIYKIDYLIITHNDEDHNGNINNLIKDFKIDNIILDGEDININNLKLKYLNIGKFDNDNDNSLVYYLNIDKIKFLFTGDISKDAERLIVNKYDLDIDILKVSHHGSNTATSEFFIGRINPIIATISTSGKYNHPSLETINILEKYSVKYFITKECGNIRIYLLKFLDLLINDKGDFVIIMK